MKNPFGMNIIPENESQRVAALEHYRILNTKPERLFDNITALAVQIFDVPIALISLVGTSQVFLKSRKGVEHIVNLPREVSPCSLAILKESTTVFPNAELEPSLGSNPLVTGDFGMRFYAGAPLLCPEGFRLGTICLIDKKPREFSPAERIMLENLSRIVMDAICLRQASLVEDEQRLARIEMSDAQETLKIIIAELANSEARFRGVFERAPLGMALLSGESHVIEFANDYMLRFWGKGPEIIGMPHAEAIPELKQQLFFELIERVYQSGLAYKGHEQKAVTMQNHELKEGFYNFVYEPLRDEHGITTSILIIADDVTEKVQTRRQANRVSEMLNMAVDSAELGTWFYQVESKEFVPSAKVKALFGYPADAEMTYQMAITNIAPDYQEQVVSAISTALKNGESYDLEFPVQNPPDQVLRWLRATGNLDRPEPGRASYYSGILMDVTARKLDDQRKNDFIAMVSHELKTPLTSLKAYIQILNSKAQNNQDIYAVNALNKAETQINKMNTLIKSFLDVARLEAGKINLNIEPFDLTALIKDVIAEATDVAQTHELIFKPCPQLMVCADKDKIAQVVTNFLSNAVKYSGWGKQIIISCRQVDDMIRVSVSDEGMGIKAQDKDKLFNRFYRIENAETHTIAGFGIGLYLCAEIIQRHHGKIWVDSEVGIGSTFHFSIPISFTIYQ